MNLKVASAYDRNPSRIAMIARGNRKRPASRMPARTLFGIPACVGMVALYLLSSLPA